MGGFDKGRRLWMGKRVCGCVCVCVAAACDYVMSFPAEVTMVCLTATCMQPSLSLSLHTMISFPTLRGSKLVLIYLWQGSSFQCRVTLHIHSFHPSRQEHTEEAMSHHLPFPRQLSKAINTAIPTIKQWLNGFPCGQNGIWTVESETTPVVVVTVDYISQNA